jgi:SP family general alpha glucoside:H+ symporter-like MFS transporter
MADPKVEAIEHIESSHGGPKVTTEGLDEFLRAEKEMTTWQAIKTHKRILFFGQLTPSKALPSIYTMAEN